MSRKTSESSESAGFGGTAGSPGGSREPALARGRPKAPPGGTSSFYGVVTSRRRRDIPAAP